MTNGHQKRVILLKISQRWLKQVQGYRESSDWEADAVSCALCLLLVFFQVKQASVQLSI